MTYGTNAGLTNIIFIGIFVGLILPSPTLVPFVYRITKKQLASDGDDRSGQKLRQETRLIFAMCGAPCIPIALFWMAWTDYRSISVWSPIVASVLFG